jgi:Co/Zn/Cd efflux system component
MVPYGKQNSHVLAGFINGLNTMFSAFFRAGEAVSHFLLDEEHHSQDEFLKASFYDRYSVIV